ncbi:MAG: S46 family peptidase [Panacagrimonas sp.]
MRTTGTVEHSAGTWFFAMKRWSALIAACCVAGNLAAAEGMWTLDNLPAKAMRDRYGFAPDAAWADHAMKASARLASGCSASFVSASGLVLSNHHCVNECVQQLSSSGTNRIRDGFYAKSHEQEVRCPEIEVNRLEQVTDVTARIAAVVEGKSGAAFADAKKAEEARIESECVGKQVDTSRCDVVDLYHGGRQHLYRYHRFQDVRLVFAPEIAIAFFGGDPDNFNFPRYDLDMSLLRVYENGRPAKIEHYFPVSDKGAEAGELVMVTGHPGSTQRLLTVAQLETLRDMALPQRLFVASEFRGLLTQYSTQSAEAERVAQNDLFGVENGIKARKGMLQALQTPEVFGVKRREEELLRAFVNAEPKRREQYGDAWDAIAKAQTTYRNIYWRHRMLEGGAAFGSQYFSHARTLVRGAQERAKPNAERLKEFGDARLPEITQTLFSAAPVYPEYEQLLLKFALTKFREILGADDPAVRLLLGKESPEVLAASLIAGSKLNDPALRKALWEGGAEALTKSEDPFIQIARLVDPDARAIRKTYENEVEAVEARSAEKLSAALFAMKGTSIYPDATFTLRLSYGEIAGWQEKGQPVPPFTTMGGAFERHTGFDPFALPASWLKSKDRINLSQRLNLVSTNDIIGGNSGSPMVNRNGEIVGLVFDGNLPSLGGSFWFDERVNRSVAVHSGAIIESLRNIYGAGALADEMSAAKR